RERPSDRSPDGKWSAFVKDHNVFVRDRATGAEFPLSKEGTADDGYLGRMHWSPDSKKLVALREKKGETHTVYEVESSPRDQVQPRLISFPYYKPGDRLPVSKPHLFDVESRKEI